MAEELAERERKHDRRWNRARRLEDDLADDLESLRRLLALRNQPKFSDVLDVISDFIEQIREKLEEFKTYSDIY